MPVARRRDMAGLDQLITHIRTTCKEDVILEVTGGMTTSESIFSPDIKPFDIFKNKILPHLIKTRGTRKSFRIWFAAASSGQEPYSLSVVLKDEAPKMPGWRTEIVGTDISHDILAKAKAGVDSQFDVQRGLPIQRPLKYFTKEGKSGRQS